MRRTAVFLILGAAFPLLSPGRANAQTTPDGRPARPVVSQAAATQPRGYTGFSIRFSMTATAGRVIDEQPPVIGSVDAGSPAQRAGLAPGDIILEVNGRDAREDGAMRVRPGVRYTYRIRRGDQEREVVLVPVARPADTMAHP
ncbi:MAG TPA: PDZ domain-containing protein [Longimicrobium sp.]|jgi:S1-C subfamily serine protease